MPLLVPLLEKMAVLMPITQPLVSSSGPPLLPGLMAASVWMAFCHQGSAKHLGKQNVSYCLGLG